MRWYVNGTYPMIGFDPEIGEEEVGEEEKVGEDAGVVIVEVLEDDDAGGEAPPSSTHY